MLENKKLNIEGDVLFEGLIKDESNLYVVDPAFFPDNSEGLHGEAADASESTTAFAGRVNIVEETEEEKSFVSTRRHGTACTVNRCGHMWNQ